MPDESTAVDCRTAVGQLWDYLDEELSEERMLAIREHLMRCEHCLPHHEFARRFLEALKATREEELMPPEVRRRVMELLAESGYSA